MKNAVLMLIGGVLLFLTLLMISVIGRRMNYSMELQSNLSSVMEEQINQMMTDENYSIDNTEVFLADFIQRIAVTLDGNYDLTVDILQLDMEKGIMAVRLKADFLYMGQKRGTAVCERVVIFNQLQ